MRPDDLALRHRDAAGELREIVAERRPPGSAPRSGRTGRRYRGATPTRGSAAAPRHRSPSRRSRAPRSARGRALRRRSRRWECRGAPRAARRARRPAPAPCATRSRRRRVRARSLRSAWAARSCSPLPSTPPASPRVPNLKSPYRGAGFNANLGFESTLTNRRTQCGFGFEVRKRGIRNARGLGPLDTSLLS